MLKSKIQSGQKCRITSTFFTKDYFKIPHAALLAHTHTTQNLVTCWKCLKQSLKWFK